MPSSIPVIMFAFFPDKFQFKIETYLRFSLSYRVFLGTAAAYSAFCIATSQCSITSVC